jgi:DNA-binding NarL/FixJ family response regulator
VLKILVADDHAVVRKGIKEILAEQVTPAFVGEAETGLEALEQALNGDWDLVLLDISMPGLSGLEVLRQIKRARPQLPVIMFSMHVNATYVRSALRHGASGYVTKETAPDELMSAIQTVLEGGQYLSQNVLGHLDDTLSSAQSPPGGR